MSKVNVSRTLREVYTLIAELWCNPSESDVKGREDEKEAERVINQLSHIDKESTVLLSKFLEKNSISEEDYIDLFELNPQCPLYLGSHTYDEPKTCANAAISDRNKYMIELAAIYKHFGQNKDEKELSDYLPLMISFLSLTTELRKDPIRDKFVKEYFLPFLPPMLTRLKELKTPYLYLLNALEKVINFDSSVQSFSKQQEQNMRVA